MAKTVTGTSKVETAYGNTLKTPISFEFSHVEYSDYSEVPESDKLTPKDMLQVVNASLKASARAKAQNEALEAAGIKKPSLDDPAVQLSTMVKVLMKAGKDESTATQLAKAALGIE